MSFATPKHARGGAVLPLAALVDMLFLLIIFLMSITAFQQEAMSKDVSLPDAEVGYSSSAAAPIKISVSKDGSIKLGPSHETLKSLESKLSLYARRYSDDLVLVYGDENATHGQVVEVLDLCQKLGFRNTRIGVQKK